MLFNTHRISCGDCLIVCLYFLRIRNPNWINIHYWSFWWRTNRQGWVRVSVWPIHLKIVNALHAQYLSIIGLSRWQSFLCLLLFDDGDRMGFEILSRLSRESSISSELEWKKIVFEWSNKTVGSNHHSKIIQNPTKPQTIHFKCLMLNLYWIFADGLGCASRTGGADIVHLLPSAIQRHGCAAEILFVSSSFLLEMHQFDIDEKRWAVLCALLEAHRTASAGHEAGKFAHPHGHSVPGAKSEHAKYEAKGSRQTRQWITVAATTVELTANGQNEEGRKLYDTRHAERIVVLEVSHDDLSSVCGRWWTPQPLGQAAQRGKRRDSWRHRQRIVGHAKDAGRCAALGAETTWFPAENPGGMHRTENPNRNRAYQSHTHTGDSRDARVSRQGEIVLGHARTTIASRCIQIVFDHSFGEAAAASQTPGNVSAMQIGRSHPAVRFAVRFRFDQTGVDRTAVEWWRTGWWPQRHEPPQSNSVAGQLLCVAIVLASRTIVKVLIINEQWKWQWQW